VQRDRTKTWLLLFDLYLYATASTDIRHPHHLWHAYMLIPSASLRVLVAEVILDGWLLPLVFIWGRRWLFEVHLTTIGKISAKLNKLEDKKG
jgi:hypothetical protein